MGCTTCGGNSFAAAGGLSLGKQAEPEPAPANAVSELVTVTLKSDVILPATIILAGNAYHWNGHNHIPVVAHTFTTYKFVADFIGTSKEYSAWLEVATDKKGK